MIAEWYTIDGMQKRRSLISVFVVFLIVCIATIVLFRQPLFHSLGGITELLFLPFQKITRRVTNDELPTSKEALQIENRQLQTQLAKLKLLEEDNKALLDQFKNSPVAVKKLLPAEIVGMRSFIPGVSIPDEIVVDLGGVDDVRVGDAALVKDILVGRVIRTSSHLSAIQLVTAENISITAKTLNTHALGVVRGKGSGEIAIENVVLSDKLEKGDIVITKGDIDASGVGYPQDLIIGKIISVNKKPSAIFQTANIQSLLDVTKLRIVFILTE